MTQINKETSWRWLRCGSNAARVAIGIAILLYLFLWALFKIDLLHIGNAFKGLQNKHPDLVFLALSGYFIFSALRHGAAYKKERAESDFAWASILWIYAATCLVVLFIDVFVVDK